MKLKPSDLSNNAYECHIIMETLRGEPVLILKKKVDSPMNWCVIHGFSTCFFTTRKKLLPSVRITVMAFQNHPPGCKNR